MLSAGGLSPTIPPAVLGSPAALRIGSDAYIVGTEWLKRELATWLGNDKNIYVVPFGVDRAFFSEAATAGARERWRQNWRIPEEAFVVLHVGSTVDRKNVPLVVQTVARLRQQTDAAQRDFENQRLRAEQSMREQDVQALLKARRWQRIAIALGVALIAVLGLIVGRQIVRTRRLRVLAATDELTGVANRRRIELMGADAVAQSRADERPLCVIAFDIDGFKAINDGHGHLVEGRRLLEAVVRGPAGQLGDALGHRVDAATRDRHDQRLGVGRLDRERPAPAAAALLDLDRLVLSHTAPLLGSAVVGGPVPAGAVRHRGPGTDGPR